MDKEKVGKKSAEDFLRWDPEKATTKQLIEISHDAGFEVDMLAGACVAIADSMAVDDDESRKVFSFLVGAGSVLRKASYNIAAATSEFDERGLARKDRC